MKSGILRWLRTTAVGVLILIGLAAAFRSDEARAEPATVDVGMYVASVFDIDFYDGTFTTIFWVWFIYEDENYNPLDAIEVTNAHDYYIMEHYGRQRSDGRHYIVAKMEAVINQPWDITNFPFDSQRLNIVLESVGKDATELVFTVDKANSVTAQDLNLNGWQEQPIESETTVYQYNSTFGEETTELLSFPRVTFTVPLERDNTKLFFEVYIGYFIAFLMISAIWLTAAMGMADYRIGMILAATFAAIGNKNVLESNYPSSPQLGLADQIEVSTFLLITVALVLSVGCERLHLSGRDALANRLNFLGFPVILSVYALFFAYFVIQAI